MPVGTIFDLTLPQNAEFSVETPNSIGILYIFLTSNIHHYFNAKTP